jgi:hypothetical protein
VHVSGHGYWGEWVLHPFYLLSPKKQWRLKMTDEKQIGDMYLAAALLAYGAKLIRTDKSDKKHQKFVFAEGSVAKIYVDAGILATILHPSLADVEIKFISKELLFPPTYPDTIRNIKSSIHSA